MERNGQHMLNVAFQPTSQAARHRCARRTRRHEEGARLLWHV